MVRRVLLAAVVAGAAAGIALTALQSVAVYPLLLAAESYEAGIGDPAPAPHRHGERTHSHAFGSHAHGHDGQALILESEEAAPADASGAEDRSRAAPGGGGDPVGSAGQAHTREHGRKHEHGHHHGGARESADDGIGRTFRTAVSNVATAIGFALLLVALFAWRGGATWRQGLLWGAAGFFVFFVNPAIGLRPGIPGAVAAGLLDRQLWWLLAVGCSAAGVGLLLLAHRAAVKVGGAVLLAVPHLAGAPRPEVPGGLAPGGLPPDELADSFVVTAAAANAAFWLVLGVVSAVAFGRFSRS